EIGHRHGVARGCDTAVDLRVPIPPTVATSVTRAAVSVLGTTIEPRAQDALGPRLPHRRNGPRSTSKASGGRLAAAALAQARSDNRVPMTALFEGVPLCELLERVFNL